MIVKNSDKNGELDRLCNELYEKYGKPLETEYIGQYLAISPEGKTFLGEDLFDVANTATETFGQGNFVYKIGEKAVGKL